MLKGYKAYNKGLICRGKQFEEGKIYEESTAVCCESGIHFCENPLDTLNFYDLCDSEFTEVEALGEISKQEGSTDTKVSTNKIKIGAKLNLAGFIKASFDYLWERCNVEENQDVNASSGDGSKLASSGDRSQLASSGDGSKLASSGYRSQLASSGDGSKLASSGYGSKLASSGDRSQLASSGDGSKLEVKGENSVGAGIGIDNQIKATLGSWITLAEWIWNSNERRYEIVCVKSVQVDGEMVKPDTWYKLENKEFVEVTNG